jgi:hypothetical protein
MELYHGSLALLNVCVDSLYLRMCNTSLPSEWLQQNSVKWDQYLALGDYQSQRETYQDFPGLGRFRLLPFGRSPYAYIFTNPEIGDIRFYGLKNWLGRSARQTGQVFIDFRSSFLQGQGLALESVNLFNSHLHDLLYSDSELYKFCRVSRADLACDWSGYPITLADIPRFIRRAKRYDAWADIPDPDLLERYNCWLASVSGSDEPQLNNKGGGKAKKNLKGIAEQGSTVCTNANESSIMAETLAGTEKLLGGWKSQALLTMPAEFMPLLLIASELLESAGGVRVIGEKELQCLYQGRFGSDLYSRFYNKSLEIKRSGKSYMKDVWRSNSCDWDGEQDVWRGEFSLSGDFLREMQVMSKGDNPQLLDCRDYYQFQDCLPEIWGYLTQKWLRHSNEVSLEHGHRSRDVNSEFWNMVSGAFSGTVAAPRTPKVPEVSSEKCSQLLAQILGCAKSHFALKAVLGRRLGNDPFLNELLQELNAYMTEHIDYGDVYERQSRYGLDSYSDAQLTTMLRFERMKEGLGS